MESNDTPLALIQEQIISLGIDTTYKVETAEQAQIANFQLGEVKSLSKKVAELKKLEIAPLTDAEKTIRAKFKPAEDLLAEVERVAKQALLGFQRSEQARNAEAEAQRKVALAAEQARAQKAADDLRSKAAAKAEQLIAEGKVHQAAAVIENAEIRAGAKETLSALVAASASVPAVQPTKLAGVSNRSTWKGEVTNALEFMTWLVAQGQMNLDDLISFKAAGLNRLATLYGAKQINGFKATEEVSIARRAA